MATRHPEAKNASRKDSVAMTARKLNVDPEWLRTGRGEPIRVHDADEAEAIAIFRQLSPSHRGPWIGAGRLLIDAQRLGDLSGSDHG